MKTKTILLFAAALAATAFSSAADVQLTHPGGTINISGTCTVEERFAGRVPNSPWGNTVFTYNPKYLLIRAADGAVLADVEVPVATEQWWGSFFDFAASLGTWPSGDYILRTQVGRKQIRLSGEGWYGWEATLSAPSVESPVIATTFAFGALTHTYDGTTKSATVTASPSSATYTAALSAGPGVGSYTVSAVANNNYSGSGSATLTIAKASQAITFTNPGTRTYGDAPFTVAATATSGLPVSFAILSGPATISGSTVTITGTGTVTVRASQGGNGNYNAATSVDQSFTVQPGAPAMLLNVAALDFGNVRVNGGSPLTSSTTFRITNSGYGPLNVNSITFGNSDYTVIGMNGGAVSFPRTLNPADILDVTVMFNPSAIGSRNTTMTIANNTATPNAVTTVTGLGQDPALKITWGTVRLIP